MEALLLNQTFYPDVVATAHYLKDFALALAANGHQVTVIASQRAYDDPSRQFPARETWNGIEIQRIRSTGLGKGARWKRAVDFASFLLACLWRMARARRPDVLVALTSPPLISFLAALYSTLRGNCFVYWVMDLNPDEAVAAGWLKAGSFIARLLDALSRYSLKRADRVIVLDRFMAARVAAHGIPAERIVTIPPWSHDDVVSFDPAGREEFRSRHGLAEKFVVMYSGNHSPCHPLTTLLEGARRLASDPRFAFLFVGGGSELPKVKQFAEQHGLTNIKCLPYQPAEQLAGSLSAADLHVVIMGDPFVGIIHPCKIYNILAVSSPVLYIGPPESHIADLFANASVSDARNFYAAPHSGVDELIQKIQLAAERSRRGETELYQSARARFSREKLLPRQVKVIEDLFRP